MSKDERERTVEEERIFKMETFCKERTKIFEEIREPNSFHKISFIRESYPFFINMSKVLSTSNVRLFLNTLPHVQADIEMYALILY